MLGASRFYAAQRRPKKHVITSQIEHKCVLDSCRVLKDQENFEIQFIKPESNGKINLDELENMIRPDTSLVSIMAVNNEIGVTQELTKIGEICKNKGVIFHTDAAQNTGSKWSNS